MGQFALCACFALRRPRTLSRGLARARRGVTSRTESLVIVPTVLVMIPTRLAEPHVWAPTGSTASGITTGTTGRPTTGRLDTGSASGTVAVRPTGSTSSTVAVRPTSGTVRVLVRPIGGIVRVPQYEHLHKKFVQVLEFVQVFGIFVQVLGLVQPPPLDPL